LLQKIQRNNTLKNIKNCRTLHTYWDCYCSWRVFANLFCSFSYRNN